MGDRRRAMVMVGLLAMAGAAALAQGFDIRPGEWEYTVSMMGAMPDIPTSVPPAAREQMLTHLKKPMTTRDCVTAKDVLDFKLGQLDKDDSKCALSNRKSTATTADFTRTCTGDDARTEVFHIEALTRESMRMTATRTAATGPGTVVMTAKWVGASCKDDR